MRNTLEAFMLEWLNRNMAPGDFVGIRTGLARKGTPVPDSIVVDGEFCLEDFAMAIREFLEEEKKKGCPDCNG